MKNKLTPLRACRLYILALFSVALISNAAAQITLGGSRAVNSDDGSTVSAGTYGLNVVNTVHTKGTFWWNSTTGGPTTNFTSRYGTSGLGPGTVRFPGGTIGNFWDWQTGAVIPQDSYQMLTPQVLVGASPVAAVGNKPASATAQPLTLPDFKAAFVTNNPGVKVIWMLNILTYSADPSKLLVGGGTWASDPIQYQVDLLLEALNEGMEVKYIELGNEFYNAKADFSNAFSNPTSAATPQNPGYNYADICKLWISEIKARLTAAGYSSVAANLEFCLVARAGEVGGTTNTWNTDVAAGITCLSTGNIVSGWSYGPVTDYDLSFHPYFDTGFGSVYINPDPSAVYPALSVDFTNISGANYLPQMLSQPLVIWGSSKAYRSPLGSSTFTAMTGTGLNNIVNTYTPSGSGVWFTEFNLFDKNVPVHATWIHGLYEGLWALETLENSHTRFSTDFCVMGDAIFSALLANPGSPNSNALDFGATTSSSTSPAFLRGYVTPQVATNYGYSASGQTFRLILDATDSMISANQINFPGDPDSATPSDYISYSDATYQYRVPSLYGFHFANSATDPTIVTAIVINSGAASRTIDMSSAFPVGGTFRIRESMGPQSAYEPSPGIIYPAYYPGVYISGAFSYGGSNQPVELWGSRNFTGSANDRTQVVFRPYSITELYWTSN